MPHGGRIRITVQQGDGGSFLDTALPARTVLLCVQDSGPGISLDHIERIFDAGFTTKKRSAPHRGLGLSIVRRLVEDAGGSVRVISPAGGGARFEVELPLIHLKHANSGFVADFQERANLEC
jgi:signal transduction histidine kinase